MIKPRIAIFINHPECSIQCVSGMTRALSPGYDITTFSKDECNQETFKNYDIVAFPGGIGDSDTHYEFFRRRAANAVADFVDAGGRYLGICMGAYWADPWYFDMLDDVRAVQYIKQPGADVRRSFSTVTPVTWLGQQHNMFFYDGCALVGDHSSSDIVATYSNGDPMAIIKNRMGLIGCHPESEEFWYDKPYLKSHWHKGEHHTLLLGFADRLMNS